MRSKATVLCVAGLAAVMVLSVAHAQDGTPNLGTSQVSQVDSRWSVDLRIYDTTSAQSWSDNTTLSLGFTSPINEATGFGLMYSELTNIGGDPILGVLRRSEREVLSLRFKHRLTGPRSSPAISLTSGADIAIDSATGMDTATSAVAFQDNFTPAVLGQIEWGATGSTMWQLAGQVAWWDQWCQTSLGSPIPGFGTVVAVGGGICTPISQNLTLTGDVMVPVSGENVIDDATNLPDTQVTWSAGGTYGFGDPFNTTLSVYATNSMAPTLASSIIGAPDNSVGFGVTLRRDL